MELQRRKKEEGRGRPAAPIDLLDYYLSPLFREEAKMDRKRILPSAAKYKAKLDFEEEMAAERILEVNSINIAVRRKSVRQTSPSIC